MAKSVRIIWQGDWTFDGLDSKGMPVDIDGTQRLGAKPSDLLPMALAACSATDLVIQFSEQDVELTGLDVEAAYTQQPEAPWTFRRIRLHYRVEGRRISEAALVEAIRRSEHELCSVASSLRGTVEIESSYELNAI